MNEWIKVIGDSYADKQGTLLDQLLKELPKQVTIVELGAYFGRLPIMWSGILKSANVKYTYTAVDSYVGSIHPTIKDDIKKALEYYGTGVDLDICDAIKAAEKFKDESVDLVYIDLDNNPVVTLKAVEAWLPKLKVGGYICGNGEYAEVEKLLGDVHYFKNQFKHKKTKKIIKSIKEKS